MVGGWPCDHRVEWSASRRSQRSRRAAPETTASIPGTWSSATCWASRPGPRAHGTPRSARPRGACSRRDSPTTRSRSTCRPPRPATTPTRGTHPATTPTHDARWPATAARPRTGRDDANARRALTGDGGAPRALAGEPGSLDERVAAWLASDDAARAAEGAGSLGLVAVAIDARELAVASPRRGPLAAAALGDAPPPRVGGPVAELRLAGSWDAGGRDGALTDRDGALLAALAADAGHPGGPLVVIPAPQLVVIAAYVRRAGDTAPPRLAVNPVALAALEPIDGGAAATSPIASSTSIRRGTALPFPGGPPPASATQLAGPRPGAGSTPVIGSTPIGDSTPVASTGGNPYSFYGSVAECAFAQRTRCEACLPAGTCRPITSITDGNAECTMLAADDGRGYFLMCINLSLAIAAVDRCTGDAAPSCVRDSRAADSLATLNNNASFLTDPTCGSALDGCLASLFGPPGDSFPGLDGGSPPPAPPRSTSVSCGNSCNNDPNIHCNASPSCDCSGPSCNNTLSCDSACSSSNDQSGCGGNCNACSSSGSGGGGGGGGCGGGSSSSGGGCSSGSGSGGGCSSGSGSGGGCSSGGCSSGGCSSGSGGGNGCSGSGSSCGSGGSCNSGSGGSCGGGGGGGKCSVAPVDPAPGVGLAMSAIWGCLPVVLAGLTRRRARRRSSRTAASEEEATEPTPGGNAR